jgi:glucose-1-phosphate thymidylyltransferase
MEITFLEDKSTALDPITLTRSASQIRCGGTTLSELVETFKKEFAKKGSGVLYINPRAIPSYEHLRDTLVRAKKGTGFHLVSNTETVAIFTVKSSTEERKEEETSWPLFTTLSEVITHNGILLSTNLPHLARGMKKLPKARNVFVGKKVSIDPSTRFDATKGPILISDNVTILPFSYLVGPLVLGEGSTVSPHSYITKSSIGPVCKVGGEITHAIMQGYSNKAHYGFLGHSYVGEWVNLGGGSATSNLKNTYGTIRMQKKDTGEQLLGSVIGDWSKISAGAIISAGKVLGVNTIVYGTVTTDVPSFTNYASKDTLIECPLEIAITIAARMRVRRDLATPASYADMMARVYEATREERKGRGVQRGVLEF